LLGPHQSLGPLGLVQLDGTGIVDAADLLPDRWESPTRRSPIRYSDMLPKIIGVLFL
jgi:hypothetical protein